MLAINLEIDRPRLHAAQFSALVTHYLRERARNLSPSTVKGYRFRLQRFLEWWDDEGPERGWVLDEDAFGDFAQFVKAETRLAWWTQHDSLRRLRQVLRWAHRRGYVAVDFSEFVPLMSGNPVPKLPIGLEVLEAIFDACEETQEPERNKAIVAILAGTGVRREECASMRAEDILIYEDGSGLIRLSSAKNDKLRTVAFDSFTGTILCEWVVMLPYTNGPLFPSRVGRNSDTPAAITPSGLHKMLTTLVEFAEVDGEIQGAHDLRRMFATTWARNLPTQGHLLQKQMGHVSYNTTQMYILNDPTDIRDAMSKQPITPVALLANRRRPSKPITPKQFIFSLSGK